MTVAVLKVGSQRWEFHAISQAIHRKSHVGRRQEKLREKGLSTSGLKSVLVKRLDEVLKIGVAVQVKSQVSIQSR